MSCRCRRSRHIALDPTARRILGSLVKEAFQQLQREWEYDGRVLLSCDFGQRLQVAQLERGGLTADDPGGVGQLLARAEFALCVNDFGALFALGFRLAGPRALRPLRPP